MADSRHWQHVRRLLKNLDREDEYLWIIAATLIVRPDPSRTDLLTGIREAAKGDHPVVNGVARKLFWEL